MSLRTRLLRRRRFGLQQAGSKGNGSGLHGAFGYTGAAPGAAALTIATLFHHT